MRSTLRLNRMGLWSSLSHSTISWHSGIHWPGSYWSASFLDIWGHARCIQIIILQLKLVIYACTHSGERKWCYSPAFPCHQSIIRNAQCNFTGPKTDPQGGFSPGKDTIVLPHNLQLNCSLDHSSIIHRNVWAACIPYSLPQGLVWWQSSTSSHTAAS